MPDTEPRQPVSHRKLGLFGLAALIGAGLIVATGIRAREDNSAKLKEWTDTQAIPTVAVMALWLLMRSPERTRIFSVRPASAGSTTVSISLQRTHDSPGWQLAVFQALRTAEERAVCAALAR